MVDGVMTTKIRTLKIAIYARVNFAPTIFDWQNVPSRFFEMVKSSLATVLTAADLRNFKFQQGSTMDDFVAIFKLFGGPSAISLSADKLSFQFPTVFPSDIEFVLNISQMVHAGFCERFPDLQHSLVRLVTYEDAEVIDPGSNSAYLSRFSIPFSNTVPKEPHLQIQPAGRISVANEVRDQHAICTVEINEIISNALFLQIESEQKLTENDTFENIMDSFTFISQCCLSILDLQRAD